MSLGRLRAISLSNHKEVKEGFKPLHLALFLPLLIRNVGFVIFN